MASIHTTFRLIKTDRLGLFNAIFEKLHERGLLNWLNDECFLKINYFLKFGKRLNLKSPKTFNEKLQWLKLYDRRPEYITMVDKIAVKDYVAERVGAQYIIPTLGVWEKPEDIDWNTLPNQFVLKWNHDSGSIVICKDKKSLDREDAINKLRNAKTTNGFWYGREWPYKGVKPLLFAEKFMEDKGNEHDDLIDYKIFCFDGKPRFIQVIQDRHKKETIDFFDTNWEHLKFVGLTLNVTLAKNTPEKPHHLKEMVMVAKELSEGIPFSRIDLYEIEDRIYFGEITFYPASGFGIFRPDEWNCIIGDMIKLPKEKRK